MLSLNQKQETLTLELTQGCLAGWNTDTNASALQMCILDLFNLIGVS